MTREDVRAGRFAGQVAMVTGAASGIGAAVAEELPGAGSIALDVADAAAVDGAFQEVLRRYGRLDVLVRAAGAGDPEAKRRIVDAVVEGRPVELTDSLDDASWRRVLRVNLDGTFHVLRAAVRVMRPAGAGAITVIGSSSAFDAPVGYPHARPPRRVCTRWPRPWPRRSSRPGSA